MSEAPYQPFIKLPPTNEPISDLLQKLDPTKKFVIDEALMDRYVAELSEGQPTSETPLVSAKGNHYLVGELHLHKIPSSIRQDFFSNLASSDTVFLEDLCRSGGASPGADQSFMGEAQSYAEEHGLKLISLTQELNRYYPARSNLWLEKGILNSEVNVPVLECLDVCAYFLYVGHTSPEVIKNAVPDFSANRIGVENKIQTGVDLSQTEKDLLNTVTTMVLNIFDFSLQNTEGMQQLISLLMKFNDVDCVVRDSAYNWIIRESLKKLPNSKSVTVVGKNHFSAIELALQGERVSDDKLSACHEKMPGIFTELADLSTLSTSVSAG